ncbi:hypothetical protein SB719_20545, partial [Pantoea sp. SIMBA_079]|uniref:hypothetical protein n=1 Tax=Pantoea sp. SIMBA_079 TaxID=3085817 RepID=UPI0039940FD7
TAQITSTDVLNYNNGYAASTALPRIATEGGTTAVNAITSSLSQSNAISRYFYNDLMANFNYDLTNDLNLKLVVGYNVQQSESKITSV